jgi:hypothetical protein
MLITILTILCLIVGWSYEERVVKWIKNELEEQDLDILCYRLNNDKSIFIERRYKNLKLSCLVNAIAVIAFNQMWMVIISLLTIYMTYKIPYWRLLSKYRRLLHQVKIEFPIWIRQVQVLMQTNTVTKAFEYSLPSAPTLLRNDIGALVDRLHHSPCAVESYTLFLHQFPILEVDRVMKMMYRYAIIGQQDANHQLNRVLAATTKLLRQERLVAQQQKLGLYQWWGIVPLLALTMLFLALMMNYLLNMLMKGGI